LPKLGITLAPLWQPTDKTVVSRIRILSLRPFSFLTKPLQTLVKMNFSHQNHRLFHNC
jgi:hypothetical protein